MKSGLRFTKLCYRKYLRLRFNKLYCQSYPLEQFYLEKIGDSKMTKDKFSLTPSFDPQSQRTESQCATNELHNILGYIVGC